MISNARMYCVTSEVTDHWKRLLESVIGAAGCAMTYLDYPPSAPIDGLWARGDLGAVMMCGLPFSQRVPQPQIVAAPVPAYGTEPRKAEYWSEFVCRRDSGFDTLESSFGSRIALTTHGSQSGYFAALQHLSAYRRRAPLFRELIAPAYTPQGAVSAVVSGRADLAPVDCYSLALMRQYQPDMIADLVVISQTEPRPIPCLVASGAPDPLLQNSLLSAHTQPHLRELLDQLLLERFVLPSAKSYRVLDLEAVRTRNSFPLRELATLIDPYYLSLPERDVV